MKFKEFRFYFLIVVGIGISIYALYVFFASSLFSIIATTANEIYAPKISTILGSLNNNGYNTNLSIDNINFKVKIVTTLKDQQKGLMNVTSLPSNEGMLFSYSSSGNNSFWMKDTLIPLDMIFMSQNKQILYIQKDALPCNTDPCQIYSIPEPSQYVLEINGGLSNKYNFKVGDIVKF